jgi:hypothetical protein
MIVGTIFIMIFGLATVSMIESIDDSVEVAEYELPNPKIKLDSVTDNADSPGPVLSVTVDSSGSGTSADGAVCDTTPVTGTGSGLTVEITSDTTQVTGITSIPNGGTGYEVGDQVSIDVDGNNCGAGDAALLIASLVDQNTITISNLGSEAVELSHIYITLSDTAAHTQGFPFRFSSEYSGSNLFIFPGEEVSSDAFPLDSNAHGYAIDTDPDRAFLAVYEHSSAVSVTIT